MVSRSILLQYARSLSTFLLPLLKGSSARVSGLFDSCEKLCFWLLCLATAISWRRIKLAIQSAAAHRLCSPCSKRRGHPIPTSRLHFCSLELCNLCTARSRLYTSTTYTFLTLAGRLAPLSFSPARAPVEVTGSRGTPCLSWLTLTRVKFFCFNSPWTLQVKPRRLSWITFSKSITLASLQQMKLHALLSAPLLGANFYLCDETYQAALLTDALLGIFNL